MTKPTRNLFTDRRAAEAFVVAAKEAGTFVRMTERQVKVRSTRRPGAACAAAAAARPRVTLTVWTR